MAYQLQEINDRIRSDVTAFLEECDQNYRQRISLAADKIVANLERSPLVLLSGPSGSGKTTTALKIEEELERRGVHSRAIAMDNYFRTLNRETAPRTPEGDIDFESRGVWTWSCWTGTSPPCPGGRRWWSPSSSSPGRCATTTGAPPCAWARTRSPSSRASTPSTTTSPAATRRPSSCIISARSDVNEGAQLRFKGTWMRLTRRAVRDYRFRGTGVAETLAMWANVRRGEKLYISPYKNRADIIFDSSLPYEVSVMKNYAKPILEAVPEENARRSELLDLIAAFDWFEPIDPALVARDSLLREFIGGGSYHYS